MRILCAIGVHYFESVENKTPALGLLNQVQVANGKKCVCCGKEDFEVVAAHLEAKA